jgi:hypothetical protein
LIDRLYEKGVVVDCAKWDDWTEGHNDLWIKDVYENENYDHEDEDSGSDNDREVDEVEEDDESEWVQTIMVRMDWKLED